VTCPLEDTFDGEDMPLLYSPVWPTSKRWLAVKSTTGMSFQTEKKINKSFQVYVKELF